MRDIRAHDVDVLTVGQYLAPSRFHMAVKRYVAPETFSVYREEGLKLGFREVVAVSWSSYIGQADRCFTVSFAS